MSSRAGNANTQPFLPLSLSLARSLQRYRDRIEGQVRLGAAVVHVAVLFISGRSFCLSYSLSPCRASFDKLNYYRVITVRLTTISSRVAQE